MVDGSLEPPHPNFWKNTFSMKGVDSNKDGVRDDVERWINRKFPGDEKYNLRNLYKQEARSFGFMLDEANSSELIEHYWKSNVNASQCAVDIYNSSAAMIYFGEVSSEVQTKIFNMPWRIFRRKKNESKLSGKVLGMDKIYNKYSTCDFEVKNVF